MSWNFKTSVKIWRIFFVGEGRWRITSMCSSKRIKHKYWLIVFVEGRGENVTCYLRSIYLPPSPHVSDEKQHIFYYFDKKFLIHTNRILCTDKTKVVSFCLSVVSNFFASPRRHLVRWFVSWIVYFHKQTLMVSNSFLYFAICIVVYQL